MLLKPPLMFLAFVAPASVAWGQSLNADYLPLDTGNRWTYEYHAMAVDYLGESFWGDSATATYTIVSKDSTVDSVSWQFEERLEGTEWRGTFGTAGHDYAERPFSDTLAFALTEYSSGAHRVLRSDGTDRAWKSVFCLAPEFSDSSRYFRFLPDVLPDTFVATTTYPTQSPYESLTVAFRRSVGIVGVSYRQFGLAGGAEWTHHELREASLTTIPPLRAQEMPAGFALENNYPNPFNPTTLITVSVRIRQRITIQIVDLLGRCVASLYDNVASPGAHTLAWDASHVSSGTYFCVARGATTSKALKLLLLR